MTKDRYLTKHIHEDVHLMGNPTHKVADSDNGESFDDVSRRFIIRVFLGIRSLG